MIFIAILSGKLPQDQQARARSMGIGLAFLILIGFLLVLEGWLHERVEELHLKNYAYFAMAFSLAVEMINLRIREKSQPVHLHSRFSAE